MNLFLRNLCHRFTSRAATRPSVQALRKAHLEIEHLESRLVPTSFFFAVSVPSAAMAGHAISVGVTAMETVGSKSSVDTGFTGSVTLKSSDGQMKPITIQLVKGQEATPASVTLTKVDTLQIVASAGSMMGTSNNITINPGVAKTLEIIGPTVAVPVNELNQIDLVALDAYGNVATISGDVQITSNAPVNVYGPDVIKGPNGSPAISMSNGKAFFYAESGRAETATLDFLFAGMAASEKVTFAG